MTDNGRKDAFAATVHGRVQGVGFRAQAVRVAGGYDVSGYVRNLADRRVELVVEGRRDEAKAFLDELAQRMDYCIRDVVVRECETKGQFDGFEVRY